MRFRPLDRGVKGVGGSDVLTVVVEPEERAAVITAVRVARADAAQDRVVALLRGLNLPSPRRRWHAARVELRVAQGPVRELRFVPGNGRRPIVPARLVRQARDEDARAGHALASDLEGRLDRLPERVGGSRVGRVAAQHRRRCRPTAPSRDPRGRQPRGGTAETDRRSWSHPAPPAGGGCANPGRARPAGL